MLRLYFKSGIKFGDILKLLKEYCAYKPNPNGAPLGDEPTQLSCFNEAGCVGVGTFAGFQEPLKFSSSGCSLRLEALHSRSLCARWNPNMDSKIHLVFLGFIDFTIYPEKKLAWKETWNDSISHAPKLYSIYKDLFLKFRCDEAQILDEHLTPLVHWVRSANYQSVIADYEFGRELTREQAYAGMWRRLMPTKEVFPEIEEEYEIKYKEMLDLRVDW